MLARRILSRLASSNNTRTDGSAESRLANTQPALPAPTMTYSKVSCDEETFLPSYPLISAISVLSSLPVPPSLWQSVARVQDLFRTPRYRNDIDRAAEHVTPPTTDLADA